MGVKKNLYFDGVNLADYGVYITGEAVYNAPARRVDVVEIPARNGNFVIDNGCFDNIEVRYPAGMVDDSQSSFATRINTVRNILASRVGYKRIQDDYNPNEYRLGMFVGGMEVSPVCGGIAGEFEIIFNCKPQRFLTSGETATAVANNGTISNPTSFESKPLIQFGGYGNMNVNGYPIKLNSQAIGEVLLASGMDTTNQTFSTPMLSVGDDIKLTEFYIQYYLVFSKTIQTYTMTSVQADFAVEDDSEREIGGSDIFFRQFRTTPITFAKGTDSSLRWEKSLSVTFTDSTSITKDVFITIDYDSSDESINIDFGTSTSPYASMQSCYMGDIIGDSTQSVLGNPLYIDCETGDCYKYVSGEIVYLNSYVTMPNDLPILSPGSNTITYDNTINNFKISPNWWCV